jgi:hypothetical protein
MEAGTGRQQPRFIKGIRIKLARTGGLMEVEFVAAKAGLCPKKWDTVEFDTFSESRASMGKQKRYSLEFENGRSGEMKLSDNVSWLARELGVDRSSLYTWKRKLEQRPQVR